MYGTATAPAWLEIVRIAQSMFMQPWKLAGGSKTLWYVRHQAIRNAEIARDRKRQNDSKVTPSVDELNRRQRNKR